MRFATSKPTIYVDCNWLAHTFGKNGGNYIKKTIMFLNALAYAGFDVYPIVDGKFRHHSKISSITRKLKWELNRINVHKLRTKTLTLSAKLRDLPLKRQIDVRKEQEKIEKELTSAEKVLQYPFPINFMSCF